MMTTTPSRNTVPARRYHKAGYLALFFFATPAMAFAQIGAVNPAGPSPMATIHTASEDRKPLPPTQQKSFHGEPIRQMQFKPVPTMKCEPVPTMKFTPVQNMKFAPVQTMKFKPVPTLDTTPS